MIRDKTKLATDTTLIKLALLYMAVVVVLVAAGWQNTTHLPGTPFYVYDGFGGIHSGDGAPMILGLPYHGSDLARDIEIVSVVLCPDADSGILSVGVWALDGFGGVHASQGAPVPGAPTPYFGFDIARDLEVVLEPFVTTC